MSLKPIVLILNVLLILSLSQGLGQGLFDWVLDGKSCREIGEQCSHQYAREKCCSYDGEDNNIQCKIHHNIPRHRFEIGVCCVNNYGHGCSIDEECCDQNAYCDLDGVCKVNQRSMTMPNANTNQKENEIVEQSNQDDDGNDNNTSNKHILFQIELSPSNIVVISLVIIVIVICITMAIYIRNQEKENKLFSPVHVQ